MKRYDVIIDGNKTTLLLTDADAAARGLTPVAEADAKAAKAPANKARKPANKRADADTAGDE